jgi:hypothetical protein
MPHAMHGLLGADAVYRAFLNTLAYVRMNKSN